MSHRELIDIELMSRIELFDRIKLLLCEMDEDENVSKFKLLIDNLVEIETMLEALEGMRECW